MSDSIKIDDVDLQIIEELVAHPMASNSDISKKVFLNRNTVAKRIQYFVDNDLIAFVPIRNITGLGNTMMLFFFIKLENKYLQDIADQLSKLPNIEHLVYTDGAYQFMAFSRFQSKWDFLDLHQNVLSKLPGIVSIKIMIVFTTKKASFPLIRTIADTRYKEQLQMEPNQLDLQIIAQLEENPREPLSRMATELNITRQTLKNRISYLIDNHFVSIITTVNPTVFGHTFSVAFLLEITPSQLDTISDFLSNQTEIIDVIIGGGCCEMLVFGAFTSQKTFYLFLRKLKTRQGLLHIEVIKMNNTVKNLFKLNIKK